MNETNDRKNVVRAKVAFLGLFVLALVSARLIVAMRTAVVLSSPIELSHAGLSVSMPQGNGWNSAKKWDYRQNAFTLYGAFTPGSFKPAASVRCNYVFPAEIIDLQRRFERQRSEIDGEIVETGLMETDAVSFDWVHIRQAEAYFCCIFGTAELPYNRRIDIEVCENTGDVDMAKRVFKAVAEALSMTGSPLLEAGSGLIAQMKAKGLAAALDNQNSQSLFLIRNSRKRIIGFATDIIINTKSTNKLNIEAMGLYYTKNPFVREEMASFQSNNRFDRFAWKTELVAAERSGTEIVLEGGGVLTVTKFGLTPEGEPTPMKIYLASKAAIPEILLEQFYARLIETNTKEALVDVITSGGRIIPTHISRIRSEDAVAEQDTPYMIKLTPVGKRGFFQLVDINSQKRVVRISQQSFERREDRFYFDRTEPEEAAKFFPKHSEFILQSDKLKKYIDE